jgi:hypothetical protein
VVRALKARDRALKAREGCGHQFDFFYRPFQGFAANAWPYQALRTSCSHLATFFRLRCRLVVS